jgi:hypothetical protein
MILLMRKKRSRRKYLDWRIHLFCLTKKVDDLRASTLLPQYIIHQGHRSKKKLQFLIESSRPPDAVTPPLQQLLIFVTFDF